jgi:hypothetical protein
MTSISAVQLDAGQVPVEVACGAQHTIVLLSSNEVVGFGFGGDGILGDLASSANNYSPVLVFASLTSAPTYSPPPAGLNVGVIIGPIVAFVALVLLASGLLWMRANQQSKALREASSPVLVADTAQGDDIPTAVIHARGSASLLPIVKTDV